MILRQFHAPLFVPGNRPERFEKAAASGADAIIIDLEDAVSPADKLAARIALRTDFTDLPVIVRINGFGTSWHEADIDAVSKFELAAVMIPKAEVGAGFGKLAASISIPILALVETARGLSEARDIASFPGVLRLVFGSVDYCADLGCTHTPDALRSARSELVLASRLADLPAPIDGVTTSIDDAELVQADARRAVEMGFGGKLAIHPCQIHAIKQGFQPEKSEIEWAERVIASGDGAAAVDGYMVDEPVRIRARSILARAAR